MITEDYVSIETAKLLKENGFDGECLYMCIDNEYKIIGSPTLQMAMKWLREEYNLNICFIPSEIEWRAYIFNKDCEPLPINAICGKTYEETCEEAIKYCLKNLI